MRNYNYEGGCAKEKLINPKVFPPGSTHATFSSNPMGTRAGMAVMDLIEEEDFESMVMEKGAYFLAHLKELKKKHKEIGDVDGLGLALRVEICEVDGFTPNKPLTDKIMNEGLKGDIPYKGKKFGLVLDVGGYKKNVFTLAPSLYITKEEIDMAVELLDQLFIRCK